MTDCLDKYIKEQAGMDFDIRTNNCVVFAMKFYGLAEHVPKRFTRAWFLQLRDVLPKFGFCLSEVKERGNVVAFLHKGKVTVGLRVDCNYIVCKAKHGIMYVNNPKIVNEWVMDIFNTRRTD